MNEYGGTVQHVLDTQFTSPVIPADQEEQGKAQLTRAAAYEISKQDPNVGLLDKPGGNQVYGFSVDVVCDRSNGDWADIATANVSGGMATIRAHWLHNTGGMDTSRWRQATEALAMMPGPMTRTGGGVAPGPEPTPPPSSVLTTNDDLLRELTDLKRMMGELQEAQNRDTALIQAKADYNTEQIQQQIHQAIENAEESGRKILALYLAMQAGGGTVPPGEEVPPGGILPGEPGTGQNALLLLLLKALAGGSARLASETPEKPQKNKR